MHLATMTYVDNQHFIYLSIKLLEFITIYRKRFFLLGLFFHWHSVPLLEKLLKKEESFHIKLNWSQMWILQLQEGNNGKKIVSSTSIEVRWWLLVPLVMQGPHHKYELLGSCIIQRNHKNVFNRKNPLIVGGRIGPSTFKTYLMRL